MAKSNKSRVVTTVTAIVLLVIIAGAIGMAAWLTNGFEDEIKAFGVTINGKYYPNNAEGLVLDKHTTATVTTDDYEVTVSAKPGLYVRRRSGNVFVVVGRGASGFHARL